LKLKINFNNTMTKQPCPRLLLAAGDFAVVEQCSCGAVHVTIGAITLRLAAGAIPSLAATMNEAARALVLAHGRSEACSELVS
jgi:hypothetical protein